MSEKYLERARKVWDEILFDLGDRRGVKHAFNGIDEDVMKELNETNAGYIAKGIAEAVKERDDELLNIENNSSEVLWPTWGDCEKWMKHEFYPAKHRDPRLQEFYDWLSGWVKDDIL